MLMCIYMYICVHKIRRYLYIADKLICVYTYDKYVHASIYLSICLTNPNYLSIYLFIYLYT